MSSANVLSLSLTETQDCEFSEPSLFKPAFGCDGAVPFSLIFLPSIISSSLLAEAGSAPASR